MPAKQKSWGLGLSMAALVVAIGLILMGHGAVSAVIFILAGVGLGIFGREAFLGGHTALRTPLEMPRRRSSPQP